MIKIIDKQDCTGCHACASICPQNCISMTSDNEGFLYPLIDELKCTKCGLCEKVCCSTKLSSSNIPSVYGGYIKDEEIRKNSSSGGFFSLIADFVLQKNGVVFGAGFDENFRVKHFCINSKENLDLIMRSKYVQSEIGNSLLEAQQNLENDKWVLFCGTPCQIGGLKSFLKKDYEKLITCDLICHGSPSPMVFEKYLKELAGNKKVKSISFRDKTFGWKKFSVKIHFDDGDSYIKSLIQDEFMRAFLQDSCLRPSCYNCKYKSVNRVSDFTLADFWGVEKINEDFIDDKGTSALIIHSKKGEFIFNELKQRVEFFKASIEDIKKFNPSIEKSVALKPLRKAFMKTCSSKTFALAYKKYCSNSWRSKIYRLCAKIYKKLISKLKEII